VIKSQQWYKDGYNLIVRFYKKIQNNLLPKNTGYAAIGTLLNCLVNDTNADPILNKTDFFFVYARIESKYSPFYEKSKLGIKYTELNYIYSEWYYAYGIQADLTGACKPRNNNHSNQHHHHQHNHHYQYNQHQHNYNKGAHAPPPRGSAGDGNRYHGYNHGYNHGGGGYNPPPPPRVNKHSHYKGLIHSRCNTANRDYKWYKDAYDLIIQVRKFAEDTRSKDDYGILGLLFNCIVNNKNTIIDREKNGSEWRKIGLIFHPDRIEKPQARDFRDKTGYTIEQMLMLSKIQSEL
jgi:hypothetical protein